MYEGIEDLYQELAYLVRIYRLKNDRNLEDAEAYFLKQQKRGVRSFSYYLGLLNALKNEHKKSLKYFKSIPSQQRDAVTTNNIGMAYFNLGKTKKAIKFLEASTRIEKKPFPPRYWTLSRAYIMQNSYRDALDYIERTIELTEDDYVKRIYLRLYRTVNENSPLPKEFLDAFENNNLPWDIKSFEAIPVLLADISNVYVALESLLLERHKKLSLRTQNTRMLAYAYIHQLKAVNNLLNKNYTLASYSIGRSMFESYLKVFHGTLSSTNRNYAHQEYAALVKKKGANERYIKNQLLGEEISLNKRVENRKIKRRLKALKKRYVSLTPVIESYSQLTVLSDDIRSTQLFPAYQNVYETGSDSIHFNRESVMRMYTISGDNSLSIANDTQNLIKDIIKLTLAFGDLYIDTPELSKIGIKRYLQSTKDLRRRH